MPRTVRFRAKIELLQGGLIDEEWEVPVNATEQDIIDMFENDDIWGYVGLRGITIIEVPEQEGS